MSLQPDRLKAARYCRPFAVFGHPLPQLAITSLVHSQDAHNDANCVPSGRHAGLKHSPPRGR
jgi:hypothetical protein